MTENNEHRFKTGKYLYYLSGNQYGVIFACRSTLDKDERYLPSPEELKYLYKEDGRTIENRIKDLLDKELGND